MSNPNQSNIFSFQADLNRFAQRIDVDIGTVVKHTVLTLHKKIVMRTPVDTGRARASWGISRGERAATVAPERQRAAKSSKQEATEEALKAQAVVKAADSKSGAYAVWWIFNNLPYIKPLEYGSSRQAPAGMVRVSMAEVEMEIARYLP